MIKILRKIYHLIQRLFIQLHQFPIYVKNFGYKVALFILVDRLFPPGRTKLYQKAVYSYLKSEFADIIGKYDRENSFIAPGMEKTAKIIWVCWFQGEGNMPELVRMCYKNLQSKINAPEIRLKLITYENIDDYVEIPSYIKDKYKEGIISHAHYSDILRIKLLRKYGGCWVDATVFVTKDIEATLFDTPFHTLKMHSNLCPIEPCMGLWSGFFILGCKGLSLFSIIDECLDRYWHTHTFLIDYIFLDYLMLVAYRNNVEVKQIMDSVPYNNEHLWLLWNNIEKPFNEDFIKEICNKGQYYKLSYQKKLKKMINVHPTVYGYLTSK